MTTIEILGKVRELPIAVESAPELARFEEFLVRRGQMSEADAYRLTGTLVASLIEGAANRAGREMRVHLREIVRLRTTLRSRFEEVRRTFARTGAAPSSLPPELEPEALRGLFNELTMHMDAMARPVRKAVDAYRFPQLLKGLDALGEHAPEPIPRDPLPNLLTDEAPQERTWTSGYEQQRVEIDFYNERERYFEALSNADPQVREALRSPELDPLLQAVERSLDPRARASADAALRGLAVRFPMPRGWQLRLRRIPAFGYTLEQIRALAERDPNFAGNGFEVTITVPNGAAPWASGPRGVTFAPDGIMQGSRGYLFLEYKTSWAPEPSGFYSSPAGRAVLHADMVARARMSMEMRGCGGWGYKTGAAWLDDAIASVMAEMRLREPALADRVHMLP